mmetsp:Transcript_13291/g.38606  ORF Transcript_13291/g.38606 Transcript_13291/m.38606 type:complete len:208 (-) Transcript_13291:16-639(-)
MDRCIGREARRVLGGALARRGCPALDHGLKHGLQDLQRWNRRKPGRRLSCLLFEDKVGRIFRVAHRVGVGQVRGEVRHDHVLEADADDFVEGHRQIGHVSNIHLPRVDVIGVLLGVETKPIDKLSGHEMHERCACNLVCRAHCVLNAFNDAWGILPLVIAGMGRGRSVCCGSVCQIDLKRALIRSGWRGRRAGGSTRGQWRPKTGLR